MFSFSNSSSRKGMGVKSVSARLIALSMWFSAGWEVWVVGRSCSLSFSLSTIVSEGERRIPFLRRWVCFRCVFLSGGQGDPYVSSALFLNDFFGGGESVSAGMRGWCFVHVSSSWVCLQIDVRRVPLRCVFSDS